MAANFFENQDVARGNSKKMVLLFVAGVLLTSVLVHLVVAAACMTILGDPANFNRSQTQAVGEATPFTQNAARYWFLHPWVMLGSIGGTIAVVGIASGVKVAQLGAGGRVVAESLGGQLVPPGSRDPQHRKLLNVVEEMAIASGTPVPPVYVMEHEQGINAFAAGFSPSDAVIGVTRGCIEQLDREELQGVIAHEFSHILNGDMKLNIRLTGLIFGLVAISTVGSLVWRVAFFSGASRTRSSSRRDSGGGAIMLVIIAVGLALTVIGLVSSVFGRWIQAAISRQREFLADASAVQFTRNPQGIGGALMKIAGIKRGSRLDNGHASEVSHMFFGQAVSAMGSLTATHPPITERIKRVMPDWTPDQMPQMQDRGSASSASSDAGAPGMAGASGMAAVSGMAQVRGIADDMPAPRTDRPVSQQDFSNAPAAVDTIGQLDQVHMAYAQQLMQSLGDSLRDAASEPFGARAVIYALLLDDDDQVRQSQWQQLQAHADAAVYDQTVKLHEHVAQVQPTARLTLVDLALPALRELTRDQYQVFRRNVQALVAADQRIDVLEWVLQRAVVHHLDRVMGLEQPAGGPPVFSLQKVRQACQTTLSVLAHVGAREAAEATMAFEQGCRRLKLESIILQPRGEKGLGDLDEALQQLERLIGRQKRAVVQACAACVSHDGKVTQREGELLRGICAAMDCPMPPLLPGQRVLA